MRPRLVSIFAVLAAWGFLHHGSLSYIIHHPACLSSAFFAQGAKAFGRFAAIVWLLAAALGLGRLSLRPLSLEYTDSGEQDLLAAALGLGLLSYILFTFGLLSLWKPAPLAVLFAILCLFAWTGLRQMRGKLSWTGGWDWAQAVFAFPILLAILYGFICANALPTEWDSLAVHLEIPRQYARSGALVPLRWLAHGFDPMTIEMLYVPGLVFKDPALPAMVSLLFQALMAASLWICGRRISCRNAALAAVALFLSQPAVTYVSGTPGTDFGVGLFAMLAFWSAWRAGETKQSGWLFLSGALSGLAAVSKTTGVFLAVALVCVILGLGVGRERGLQKWLLGWLVAAALFASPWLLRNLVYNHNPVWPYLPQLFGGSARDAYLFARVRAATLEGYGSGWLQFLLLPLNLVFRPEGFRHSSQVLMIPLLILGAASWRQAWKDPFARWTLAYAGIFALLWSQAVQNWRYFIPLMPWLCLLICGWAARAWSQGLRGRLLACVLAVGFLGVPAMSANNALFSALGLRSQDRGLTSREAYLSHSLDSYPAMARINQSFPANARILLYREVRPFYLDREYLIGDPQNEMLIGYERIRTPEELYQRLRALGISHVLVDPALQTFSPNVPDFLRAEALMKEALERYAEEPLEINGVLIYSWRTP